MKKILLSAILALSAGVSQAQTFFTSTSYRGAFAPAPTPMWTNNWTEWDPQNAAYPAPTTTVSGNITSNTTWSTGQVVYLQGPVYVKNNSVLTIQPGVIVRCSKAIAGSGLFVTKGSQLNAAGTATAPIVFTSDQAPGSRGLGDWGGIILLGKADNNNPGGVNYIEGIAQSPDTEYGGGTTPDDNDNSGTLKYVRIEFAGYVYASNKEINGLTLGAVGRNTTIEYIQCSFVNDDAFEWFGGTVNCKYLVAYRCLDDNWDADNGYRGYVQFCLGVRDPQIADAPTVSTSEGFEVDNDPNGSTNTPITAPIFSNVTDIGPLRGVTTATSASGFRRGARLRRNAQIKIYNSIFMDHATRGLFIDGSACETNANNGSLKFKHNVVAGYGQRAMETGTAGVLSPAPNTWIASQPNDTLKLTTNILTNPYQYLTPDYRPTGTSVAASAASFTDAAIAPLTSTTSSISEKILSLNNLTLSPNPANKYSLLNINASQAMKINVELYSIDGKLVSALYYNESISTGNNTLEIQTENLSTGLYFVIVSNEGSKQTLKLTVTH
ncbi:MAG: T9SS type A sorting domain-containing protein [Sediminibacterium sp.]|nr:T9SS type A sorting domain-containing protein [Sediminibacterium sp.]